jgi:nucleoside-diphosphate-sugar epimerase
MEVWRGIAEGLNAVIINPGIILGEGNWNDGSANLIKMAYKEFPFYTEGINGWVDVNDVIKAMYELMKSNVNAERFIISSGNFAYQEIFTLMAKAVRKKPPHIKAGPFLTNLIAVFTAFKTRITGHPSLITKETSRNAQKRCFYNNEKLVRYLPGFSYIPLETTINRLGTAFLKDIG